MHVTDLQIDRPVSWDALLDAAVAAFGVPSSDISIWRVLHVEDAATPVILQVDDVGGDFPLLLRISASGPAGVAARGNLENLVRTISREINAAVIVDSFGVEPAFDDDWLLITPQGELTVVQADLDALTSDIPTVILVPESRATYTTLMHRQLAAAG